ncbi:MAG: hypothetical protein ABUS57_11250 [Pseudomonadota bacterium]
MNQGQSTLIGARILGPLMLAFGILLIVQRSRILTVLEGLMDDEALMLVGGVISLFIGLVIVALHTSWRGITAILVSLIGWASVIRGAAVLFVPDLARSLIARVLVTPQVLPIAGCALAFIGLWLTFIGLTGRAETDSPLGQIR